ncbi:hypothetical protein J2129_000539 [Methanofollis sp. W23]|uniref:hypothetical protein n=1 Tax=Methanofollis sp. W23 TaxID=2817849 RepID=UPI001AEA596F|nr:hypothetical protein [Methanofollis sp. W23]MBP2145085.1 hypothetical protein [Methanofollis sp. W23]
MAEEEELFDLLIPPGVPRTAIRAIIEKYDVDLVDRAEQLNFANMDGDTRYLLAFRGKKEVLEEAEKDLRAMVLDFIGKE